MIHWTNRCKKETEERIKGIEKLDEDLKTIFLEQRDSLQDMVDGLRDKVMSYSKQIENLQKVCQELEENNSRTRDLLEKMTYERDDLEVRNINQAKVLRRANLHSRPAMAINDPRRKKPYFPRRPPYIVVAEKLAKAEKAALKLKMKDDKNV